ncbi:MAG TPA: non-canonical purine NTP pyrophosphatase, partial [Clostridia bacterium]|nr:non-canonical purine NTP pyrophosphatase [Clostridia bacterium]
MATRNNGKIEELNEMLRQSDFEVVSIKDYPDFPEIVEDGDTF